MSQPCIVEPAAGATIDTVGGTLFDRPARPRPSAKAAGSDTTIVTTRSVMSVEVFFVEVVFPGDSQHSPHSLSTLREVLRPPPGVKHLCPRRIGDGLTRLDRRRRSAVERRLPLYAIPLVGHPSGSDTCVGPDTARKALSGATDRSVLAGMWYQSYAMVLRLTVPSDASAPLERSFRVASR